MGVYSTYKSKIGKAQNAGAAASQMHDAIDAITTGFFNKGVSDKEQKEIVQLLDYFGQRWNIDVSELKAAWDPDNKTYHNDLFGWFADDYRTLASQTKTALTNAAVSNSSDKKATMTTPDNNVSNSTTNPPATTPNKVPSNTGSTGGGGGGTDPAITQLINDYKKEIADRDAEIYDLKHPKEYSADDMADILKADYGIEDIHTLIDKDKLTDQFNAESNAYYDAMIAAENNYRNQYLRNTGGEYERLIEDYIQSTRNNAKTRYNNSRNAMNTLQSQLYGNRALGNQDTVFNQAVNQLEKSRLAELANNPNLAKQFATNERTKLAQIGLNYTDAELAAYSADRQAMANRFAANRAYDNAYIGSINTLYNSAANAAISRAQGAQNAGNSSTFQKLYDTIQAMNPNYNAETISTMTQNILTSTYKNAQASNK